MLQRETNTTSGKITLILPKSCQKLMSSKCSRFGLTTYFLCLVGMFFNRQSACIWVLTVHLFSPTCSFIRTRQTSYRGLLNKCGKKLDPSFNFTFRDIEDVLPLNNIYNQRNTTDATSGADRVILPEHLSLSPIFCRVEVK